MFSGKTTQERLSGQDDETEEMVETPRYDESFKYSSLIEANKQSLLSQ